MTLDERIELTRTLAGQGLTVIPTRDYDGILLQLARLAQFERLVMNAVDIDPLGLFEQVIAEIHTEMNEADNPRYNTMRPMDVVDIPMVQMETFRALYARINTDICLDPTRVDAAVSAFAGILFARVP